MGSVLRLRQKRSQLRIWGSGELSIWAERRLGQLIVEGQKSGKIEGRGRPSKKKSHDVTLKLEDIGIEKMRSHRAQKFARLSDEQIRNYSAGQREIEDEITKARPAATYGAFASTK